MGQVINLLTDFEEEKVVVTDKIVKPPKGSRVPLTPEQEQGVVKMYKNGAKVEDIKEKFKIATGRVYRILRRNNVERRLPQYSSEGVSRMLTLTDWEKKNIVDDYIRKVPILEIMGKYGINKPTLYYVLDERQIVRQTEKDDEEEVQVAPTKAYAIGQAVTKEVDSYIQDRTLYIRVHKSKKEIDKVQIEYLK
ncbi:DNA binding protein [Bacillus phage CAM003]|uniref:Uncharacterized protein n=2 Tax=Bastillevirus CAM003 TaxID=1918012 RepID=A0A024B0G1_9CAUD|nr:DNA binding protein [Bacillus phage CAM003]AHZ09641.1 hypothetical protein [Bacillus phage CAM003]ASU01058.1 transposase-associated HTH domain-containing protein [Bacillus phage Anthony]